MDPRKLICIAAIMTIAFGNDKVCKYILLIERNTIRIIKIINLQEFYRIVVKIVM